MNHRPHAVRGSLLRVALPLVALLCALGAPRPAPAQDGAIVERDTLAFTADQKRYFSERAAKGGTELDVERLVVQRITYLSDGLRVKGYLVEPATGDSLPVLDPQGP